MRKALLTLSFISFLIISGCQKEDKVSCSEIMYNISRQEEIKEIALSSYLNSLISLEAYNLQARKADAEIVELTKGLVDCE